MTTSLRKESRFHRTPARRWLLAVSLMIVVLVAAGTWTLLLQTRNAPARQTPPPNFQLVTEVDLSSGSHNGETLLSFTLDEPSVVGIYFAIEQIDTRSLDLRLVGADGQSAVLLHAEDYRTDRDGGGLWEQRLEAGTYQLLLSAAQSPGRLAVYHSLAVQPVPVQ